MFLTLVLLYELAMLISEIINLRRILHNSYFIAIIL